MRTLVITLALTFPLALAAQVTDSLPAGVTPQMVERGKLLYEGPGLCENCHGSTGKGIANAGADLTDSVWVHGDGSYESIVQVILEGISAHQAASGNRMPPKGGSGLTDAHVRAVAAYVWSLRRTVKP